MLRGTRVFFIGWPGARCVIRKAFVNRLPSRPHKSARVFSRLSGPLLGMSHIVNQYPVYSIGVCGMRTATDYSSRYTHTHKKSTIIYRVIFSCMVWCVYR